MASATNSYLSNVISYHVHHHGFIQQKYPLPLRHIQIKLAIDINLLRTTNSLFWSQHFAEPQQPS
ncbi:hypothetical protein Golax_023466 [Gossypium laxum]|uniref:Uncharacterized protein n=1 Tax=Gossypium laxum TaxID=34288 RepID=A0A7J8Z9U2_9ROSI|nr:hypothetical protein [Gossypium laxum]